MKDAILENMAHDMLDQSAEQCLAASFSCFDVERQDDMTARKDKLANLYEIYGHNKDKDMPEWLVNKLFVHFFVQL